MDTLGTADPYIKVMFGGSVKKTKVMESDPHPTWYQSLFLTVSVPSMTKNITVEVWDYDTVGSDERIGSFKIRFSTIDTYEIIGPRWYEYIYIYIHIYKYIYIYI